MDASAVITFPRAGAGPEDISDLTSRAIAEIDAAIALVASGAARRVRLTGVPFIESVAGIGLARSRAAGVTFALERPERIGVLTVTVGPVA
jgi:hypothetical protein